MARIRRFLLASIAAQTLLAPLASDAGDGVIEINQACAVNSGCLPGDTAGFPVTISTSGSYRLTGNLTNSDPNVSMINVNTSNVSMDLNGFSLVGPATCSGAGTAISCLDTGTGNGITASQPHVSVRNGVVRGAGRDGILLGTSCRLERVTLEENGRDGLGASNYCVIESSSSRQNGERGFSLADNAVVSHCNAAQNGTFGILAAGSAVISESASRENGSDGIYVATASNVSRSSSYDNEGDQIEAIASAVIANSVRSLTGQGWGLNLSGLVASGYSQNTITMSGAAGLVTGGVSAGDNACNGVLC
jgi:hypothetical protein